MTTKQFFSNNYDINYNDYLKYKKGKENIKKLIHDKKYYLNTFIDYDTFLTLSKAYYKQINNKYNISPPTSISDADTSYKCYKSMETHVKNCNYCCNGQNIHNVFYCKEIQNILYPYGESIVKRDDLEGIYYPRKLRLNSYCCKKCEKTDDNCDNNLGLFCNSLCKSPCHNIKETNFHNSMKPFCYHQQNCSSCVKNNNVVSNIKKYNVTDCGCKSMCKKCNISS